MSEPILRIERGEPTPEEAAALIAAVAVMVAAQQQRRADPPEVNHAGAWSARVRNLRRSVLPGVSWRGSLRR